MIKLGYFYFYFIYDYSTGIDDAKKKEIQFSRPRQMYNDIQDLLTNGGSPNKVNDNGVSLVSTWGKMLRRKNSFIKYSFFNYSFVLPPPKKKNQKLKKHGMV